MTGLRLALVALVSVGLIAIGCGDDEESEPGETTAPADSVPGAEEAAALQEEIADLPDEEQVARVGDAWADPFGKGDEAMCGYLHPDLAPASSCDFYLEGELTGSSELQTSFEGATVEGVEVDGEGALARFSNENQVRFGQDPDGAWKVVETARAKGSGSDKVLQPR